MWIAKFLDSVRSSVRLISTGLVLFLTFGLVAPQRNASAICGVGPAIENREISRSLARAEFANAAQEHLDQIATLRGAERCAEYRRYHKAVTKLVRLIATKEMKQEVRMMRPVRVYTDVRKSSALTGSGAINFSADERVELYVFARNGDMALVYGQVVGWRKAFSGWIEMSAYSVAAVGNPASHTKFAALD